MTTEQTEFQRLDALRSSIEQQIHSLEQKLKEHKVTMGSSLLTLDGYPRSDIDIPEVTSIRRKILMLQNDFKKVDEDLQREVEKLLGV